MLKVITCRVKRVNNRSTLITKVTGKKRHYRVPFVPHVNFETFHSTLFVFLCTFIYIYQVWSILQWLSQVYRTSGMYLVHWGEFKLFLKRKAWSGENLPPGTNLFHPISLWSLNGTHTVCQHGSITFRLHRETYMMIRFIAVSVTPQWPELRLFRSLFPLRLWRGFLRAP